MKILIQLITISIALISYTACSPPTSSGRQLDCPKLTKILNNSILIADTTANYLSLRIYTIDNGTASAGYPSSEVSHNLLLAISGFDEAPDQNLFEIGPFYDPRFVEWNIMEDAQRFSIDFLEFGSRQEREYAIELGELTEIRNQ